MKRLHEFIVNLWLVYFYYCLFWMDIFVIARGLNTDVREVQRWNVRLPWLPLGHAHFASCSRGRGHKLFDHPTLTLCSPSAWATSSLYLANVCVLSLKFYFHTLNQLCCLCLLVDSLQTCAMGHVDWLFYWFSNTSGYHGLLICLHGCGYTFFCVFCVLCGLICYCGYYL